MQVYFIAAEDADDCTHNLDLFVQADNIRQARALWRKYYERDDEGEILRAWIVPELRPNHPPQAINWDDVELATF